MRYLKLWENYNEDDYEKENQYEPEFDLGDSVVITSDNENYIDYLDKKLIITHVATNTSQHRGYDDSMSGMGLYDFETEDGIEVPFSLYDYEIENI